MARTVLHVIDTPGPGGAETVYLDLVRGLNRAKYRSLATTGVPGTGDRDGNSSERGWLHDQLSAACMDPVVLPTTRSFDLPYLGRIIALARRERAAVIHSHLLTANVYCALAGILTGIPVVTTFHGAVDIAAGRMTRAKLHIMNRGAKRVVFVSRSLRDLYLASTPIDPAKAAIVYNGIDTSRFRPNPSGGLKARLGFEGQLLVGSVGNIRAAKGYDVLLEAAGLVRTRAPRLRFVIAGDDKASLLANLEKARTRLGLDGRVVFVGFGEDVPSFLNGLDIFALPSRTEGFSLATVEAMSTGLPVIATRCGGPEEIVRDHANGLLVDANSPAALAEGLLALHDDSALRARLAAAARRHAMETFDTSAMIRGYEAIYDQL